MDKISLTSLIALYGAILSSVLLGWNIYRDLTDRGKLRVHCYIGNIIISCTPPDDTEYLMYIVTNVGRKPILVTHIGGKKRNKKDFFITSNNFPKMLNPGEYLTEYTPDLSLLNENLVSLWAIDSLGKAHKVNKSVVKKLIKERKEKRETKII